MKRLGIRRLIAVATPSAPASDDLPDPKFRILVSIIRTTMRPAYDEIVGVAQAVRASDLDWTIVRVSTLNNKPGSGKISVGYLGRGEVGAQISRADMAGFILDELRRAVHRENACNQQLNAYDVTVAIIRPETKVPPHFDGRHCVLDRAAIER
jgi:hypothetical protein